MGISLARRLPPVRQHQSGSLTTTICMEIIMAEATYNADSPSLPSFLLLPEVCPDLIELIGLCVLQRGPVATTKAAFGVNQIPLNG
jgi:hypothetical protein